MDLGGIIGYQEVTIAHHLEASFNEITATVWRTLKEDLRYAYRATPTVTEFISQRVYNFRHARKAFSMLSNSTRAKYSL